MKLRMLAVVVATALVGTSAAAEALYVSRMDLTKMTVIDRDSIRWNGEMPTVKTTDVRATPFPAENGEFIREDTDVNEYDCKGSRYRIRAMSSSSWTGKIVSSDDHVSEWFNVVPRSYGAAELDLVCFNKVSDGMVATGGTMDDARRRYFLWLADELDSITWATDQAERAKALKAYPQPAPQSQ